MTSETLNVVVKRRELQGDSIVVLELVNPTGAPLPAFDAGAHIDLHLDSGLIRQYSLCGNPSRLDSYRLGVLRDPASRGGSTAVHDQLREGNRLTISAPRNHFPLYAAAQHSILVGGGIGITPMLAMACDLYARGASFELHYCARSRAHCAFLGELAAAPWVDRVHLHMDDEGEAQRFEPATALLAAPANAHLYVCGPAGFMEWVMSSARTGGLAETQIHREYFSAPATPGETADAAFEVVAQRSGKTFTVEAGQTLVQALIQVGIAVNVSCEQGVCGTCLCDVLEGEPDHRDVYLTAAERAANDQMLVCCSRARSARLVLDL
jgi:ferredoxin-NADP reductase